MHAAGFIHPRFTADQRHVMVAQERHVVGVVVVAHRLIPPRRRSCERCAAGDSSIRSGHATRCVGRLLGTQQHLGRHARPKCALTADALALDQFNLWGISTGGAAAIWLAVQAPERLSALVLAAPSAIVPPGNQPAAGTPEEMARILYGHPERMPPMPARDPAVLKKQGALVGRLRATGRDPDLEARMRRCEVPTLVLWGTLDRLIPPETGSIYKELMPNCHLVLVYDAGHLIDAERPEACVEVMVDFLERHEAFLISRTETMIHP